MKKILSTLVVSGTLCSLVATDINSKKDYFLGVGLNHNSMSVKKRDISGNIPIQNKLDDTGSSINIQAGKRIDNYLVSINYETANLDGLDMDSLYLSIDHEFDTFLNPFIGISLGTSDLKWKVDPLGSSKRKDEKLSSLLYGIHAGVNYQINNNWSIYSILSYQKLDFTTKLIATPALSEITHEAKTSIGIGLRYYF